MLHWSPFKLSALCESSVSALNIFIIFKEILTKPKLKLVFLVDNPVGEGRKEMRKITWESTNPLSALHLHVSIHALMD